MKFGEDFVMEDGNILLVEKRSEFWENWIPKR